MKQIILIIAFIALAFAVCPGYTPDSGKTCLGPYISGCITFAAPELDANGNHLFACSACDPAYQLSEDKLSCEHKSPYDKFTRAIRGTGDLFNIFADQLGDTMDYSIMSCIIDGQIIQNCQLGAVYSTETYKCIACEVENCISCAFETIDTCQTCLPGYIAGSDAKSCVLCDPKAISCTSETVANECVEGFFFDTTSSKCISCGATGILTCTEANKPTACEEGYYLKTGTTNTCETCNTLALTCTSDVKDTECKYSGTTNYNYMLGTVCTSNAITIDCLLIEKDANNAIICKTCIDGFLMSNGVCDPCTDFVDTATLATCDKATITNGDATTDASVTACADGYYLNVTCFACATGCAKCTYESSAEKCTQADVGYYLDYDVAVKACDEDGDKDGTNSFTAEAGCATCTVVTGVSGTYTCNSCQSDQTKQNLYTSTGTAFTGTPTVSCIAIDTNCTETKLNDDQTTPYKECVSCLSTHSLQTEYNETGMTTVKGITCVTTPTTGDAANCSKYKFYDTTADEFKCTECISGYIVSSDQCVTVTNCKTMDTATACKVCNDDFVLTPTVTSANTCIAAIDNCAEHELFATAKCKTCDKGYYFGETA